MKNYFIIVLALFTQMAFGQEKEELPYSTIHFVRSSNYFGSLCKSDITLPNQRHFNLSLNSIVKYKVYSDGEITATLEIICPATQTTSTSSSSKQITLNVTRGNDYYVFYNAGSFKEVEKSDVQKYLDKSKNVMKQEESFDNPINRESLKDISKKEGKGQGTCFLISAEGYLITNYHCVKNSKEIIIKGIGSDFTTKYSATLIASDPSNDLALMKFDNKNLSFSNPPFSIKSTGVSQAERVYALGFPQAYAMGEDVKVTEGIISSKSGISGDISKFQISAAVNPGNSGGPLIDESGDLIGVIYAKSTIAESAGYAIKANYLEVFLKNIDGFVLPVLTNTMKDKSLTEKIALLKEFVFIIETN